LVTKLVHEDGNALTAVHAHDVIFEDHIEFRSTGITLAARTSAQLPVHTAALMTLRTNDGQTTGFFYTWAEFDIRTTTGHVGSNGNGACKTGFRYNLRFTGVLFRIEDIVRNFFHL